MSAVLTRCRVSSEQLDLLLSFMEDHPDFATGSQAIYSRFSWCKLWRLLGERLNAVAAESGGARKSPDKWCRYWADIKYKTRRKSGAGAILSSAEERVQSIFNNGKRESGCSSRENHSDEKPKPTPLEDDMRSEESAAGDGEGARLNTEELLAEAALRSALAAEKQAEAVTQAVELLRELVGLLRDRVPAPPAHSAPLPEHALAPLQHHVTQHHRL